MRVESLQIATCAVVAFVGALSVSCGDGREAKASAAPQQTAARSGEAQPPAEEASPPVKACSVVTRAEVEALISQEVLDPVEETIANLSTCSFGEPGSPIVHGRSMDRPVIVSVFTGGNGYYAGPVAQARELYEIAEKSAGEIELVSGLGDRAHWTGTTLRILRGPYMIEVEVHAGDSSRSIAGTLVRRAGPPALTVADTRRIA